MKKWGLVLVVFILFFLFSVNLVWAECQVELHDEKYNSLGIATRSLGGSVCTFVNDKDDWWQFGGDIYDYNEVRLVCDGTKFNPDVSRGYNRSSGLKYCGYTKNYSSVDDLRNDLTGTTVWLNDFMDSIPCTVNAKNKDMEIVQVKFKYFWDGMDASKSLKYNDGSLKDDTDGHKHCLDSLNSGEIGVCNYSIGRMELRDICPNNQICVNKLGKGLNGAALTYKCIPKQCNKYGVTTNQGDSACITVENIDYVAVCDEGTFVYDEDDDRCSGECSYGDKGPECTGNSGNLASCINNVDGSSLGNVSYSVGTTVCNGTEMYVCESIPNLSFVKSCTDGQICGKNENTKIYGCFESDDVDGETTVTLSISTDTGFMCDSDTGVQTAFGCIPITASGLANKLLPILFGIAGGISFLRMVLGFIMIATSSGDEKKFIEAKSIISSAIIGLLVSIFAIFLFRLIFVNILQIPGLS